MCVCVCACLRVSVCIHAHMRDTWHIGQRPCHFIEKPSDISLSIGVSCGGRQFSQKGTFFLISSLSQNLELSQRRGWQRSHSSAHRVVLSPIIFNKYFTSCISCPQDQRLTHLFPLDFDCKSARDKDLGGLLSSSPPVFSSSHPCHQMYLVPSVLKPFKGSPV